MAHTWLSVSHLLDYLCVIITWLFHVTVKIFLGLVNMATGTGCQWTISALILYTVKHYYYYYYIKILLLRKIIHIQIQ